MPARKVKAKYEQIKEDVMKGLTVADIFGKYGYASLDSTAAMLHKLGLIHQARQNAEERKRRIDIDARAHLPEFDNAIAHQYWGGGRLERFCRIEEVWKHENYTQIQELEAKIDVA